MKRSWGIVLAGMVVSFVAGWTAATVVGSGWHGPVSSLEDDDGGTVEEGALEALAAAGPSDAQPVVDRSGEPAEEPVVDSTDESPAGEPVVGQPDMPPVKHPVVGPTNGALVIVGGAMRDPEIFERFLELVGGPHAPIVVIPTAGGRSQYGESNSGLAAWRRHGATDLTVVHTTDREEADSDEFVAPIRRAVGVWFNGGRQWRLADAYLGTKTHDELWKLLERGGVIGGSSAGATIQGSYLVRGDTSTNDIMMGDHDEGFGFLRNTAIDQHLLQRNRQFDLVEVINAHPGLLGIGIDEDTAIVVRGDQFEVVGDGYVAIYDHGKGVLGVPNAFDIPEGRGGPFYFLAPGDRFDLDSRVAFRQSRDPRPLNRVGEVGW